MCDAFLCWLKASGERMNTASRQIAVRTAARTVAAALLLAMMLQFLALSAEDRAAVWLTGSLCAPPGASQR